MLRNMRFFAAASKSSCVVVLVAVVAAATAAQCGRGSSGSGTVGRPFQVVGSYIWGLGLVLVDFRFLLGLPPERLRPADSNRIHF